MPDILKILFLHIGTFVKIEIAGNTVCRKGIDGNIPDVLYRRFSTIYSEPMRMVLLFFDELVIRNTEAESTRSMAGMTIHTTGFL